MTAPSRRKTCTTRCIAASIAAALALGSCSISVSIRELRIELFPAATPAPKPKPRPKAPPAKKHVMNCPWTSHGKRLMSAPENPLQKAVNDLYFRPEICTSKNPQNRNSPHSPSIESTQHVETHEHFEPYGRVNRFHFWTKVGAEKSVKYVS